MKLFNLISTIYITLFIFSCSPSEINTSINQQLSVKTDKVTFSRSVEVEEYCIKQNISNGLVAIFTSSVCGPCLKDKIWMLNFIIKHSDAHILLTDSAYFAVLPPLNTSNQIILASENELKSTGIFLSVPYLFQIKEFTIENFVELNETNMPKIENLIENSKPFK